MMIIQISGKLRKGKGILATFFGLLVADHGGKVLSNYDLYANSHSKTLHPNVTKLDFYDFLHLLKLPRQVPTKTILIDELPTWIDSYCTTKEKSNRYASYFCNQSAKLGYNMIYTTQRTRRADINYREMADLSYRATKEENNARFHYVMLDERFTDEDVETDISFNIPFGMASLWWDRYNTYQSVTPLGLDDFFFELEKTDPKRFLATVHRQAHLLRQNKLYPRTVKGVELALMELGELPAFAAHVKELL